MLVLMVPALDALFRFVVAERMGTIILSALVAHTAWHWMIDRYGVLRQFPWPTVTAADAAIAIRWAMALIALAAIAYLLSRATASARESDTPHTPGRVPNEVTLLELNRQHDVGGRHERKHEVRRGHRRGHPERQQKAEIQRVPDVLYGSGVRNSIWRVGCPISGSHTWRSPNRSK